MVEEVGEGRGGGCAAVMLELNEELRIGAQDGHQGIERNKKNDKQAINHEIENEANLRSLENRWSTRERIP